MTRILASDLHARLTALIGLTLVISILSYGAFILLMVTETAYRANAETALRSLISDVATLENTYLTAEEGVTLQEAQARGFVEAKKIARIAREGGAGSLSMRSESR